LPAARVFGTGVVLSADGTALARDVAEDFGKPSDAHWLLGYGEMRAPVALAGVTAVAAVNRGAGYCHWLLEELPRLLALPVGGEADNIIAHAAGGFAREAWAARGGRETLVVARRASHFSCAPLLVPGLAAEAGWPTPTAVRRVREFAERLGRDADARAVADAVGERVYVSRAKAARRRVGEEDALWRELEARGFARVFFEDLSWAAQIAVARRARVMVGAHGAGLANTLFCAPGARVVELVNRGYFNPVFWRLAALGGLDYRPLVTEASDEGDPIREERARNREDVAVDLAAMRAALAG
jgi:capsular polysaccharide biosynthesis protein